jgi:hypothetical protein
MTETEDVFRMVDVQERAKTKMDKILTYVGLFAILLCLNLAYDCIIRRNK